MELLAAISLGIVQGLTEFLPVSSSAHLILVPWFLGWTPEGLFFDVALHFGTAFAVVGFFWSEWVTLGKETLLGIWERQPFANAERRLAWFLIVGTLPAMLVGLALEKYVTEYVRSPLVTVGTLVVFGVLLSFAEKTGRHNRSLAQFTWSDCLWIGASQAIALVPGVSRSGITMSTAMLRDVRRPEAARFSFLLSTPVIVGAALLEGWHFWKSLRAVPPGFGTAAGLSGAHLGVLLAGVVTAGVSGWLGIRYFLRYVQGKSLLPFVIYRFFLAAMVLIYYFKLAGG
jgi:undecaprenyl-diphosphatase